MDFKFFNDTKMGFGYYKAIHESGLTVLLYPNEKYTTTYALYGTNFGSVDNAFSVDGEFTKIPDGIAHFLEHKLFESEEKDAFQCFAVTGASSNAYTSFDKTCYLFSCADNFYENLDILLDFVNQPYFTKETVDKEMGIIGQEIRMYDDSAGWQVLFGLLGGLFVNSPVKIDIAGTEETIAEITDKTLYNCYNAFYNQNNMVLSIAGNFEIEKIIPIIDKNIKIADEYKTIKEYEVEPDEIVSSQVTKELEVAMPLFSIGFKEIPDREEDKSRGELMNEILLVAIAGEDSPLYCKLYDTGLINMDFSTEVFMGYSGRNYLVNMFDGESEKPDEVCKEIVEYIENLKKTGISVEDFERARKFVYGKYIKSQNSMDSVANQMLSLEFSGTNILELGSMLKDITADEVNTRLRKQFRKDKMCLSKVVPKKECN